MFGDIHRSVQHSWTMHLLAYNPYEMAAPIPPIRGTIGGIPFASAIARLKAMKDNAMFAMFKTITLGSNDIDQSERVL